jgi:hypothetical protein
MKYLEARKLWEAQQAIKAAEKAKKAKPAAKMERPVYEDKMLRVTELEDKAEEPQVPEGVAVDGPEDEVEWPLKMRPGTYLGLHPEGQWADLALAVLASYEGYEPEPENAPEDQADEDG